MNSIQQNAQKIKFQVSPNKVELKSKIVELSQKGGSCAPLPQAGNGVILEDVTKKGRQRPWAQHKSSSMLLTDSYARLGMMSKAERVLNCASVLHFDECPNGCGRTLKLAYFCQVRLCPMCGWRRSLAAFHQVRLVAHHAALRKPKLAWLFLTLTVKNCEGEELKATIDHMMKAWNRLTMYKAFGKVVVGWFRSFEITRSEDGTYHPHFHVLIAVEPSYFTGKNYINQQEWTELWQRALQDDYKPMIHIKRVQGKRNEQEEEQQLTDLTNGLLESTKYVTKSKDYLVVDKQGEIDKRATDEAVSVLDASLAHRRLFAYGGLLKTVWNDLRASGEVEDVEDEDADLIHVKGTPTACKCSVCQSDMLSVIYRYVASVKKYVS